MPNDALSLPLRLSLNPGSALSVSISINLWCNLVPRFLTPTLGETASGCTWMIPVVKSQWSGPRGHSTPFTFLHCSLRLILVLL